MTERCWFRRLFRLDVEPALIPGRDKALVYVASCVTLCQSRQIVIEVYFEGLPTMHSEAGKAAEMEAIQKAAEAICLSVE